MKAMAVPLSRTRASSNMRAATGTLTERVSLLRTSATSPAAVSPTATGTPSISADPLALNVTQGTPGQPILFFQGINVINAGNGVVFGDGLRCCGGSVIRLEIRTMTATGDANTTVVLSVRGSASAGDTFCNQGWFRDPPGIGGSPCSTFFNLTNALSVPWRP